MNLQPLLVSAVALLAFGVSSPSLLAQQTQPDAQASDAAKPAIVFANVARLKATVTDVDKAERLVTLRGDDGREQTIKCGPEVRNFDQIEVGDRVTAEYREATAIFARMPEAGSGAPSDTARRQGVATYGKMELAPLGQKPGGMITDVTEVTATVQDIDYAKRQLTLLGPGGRARIINVSDNVQNLDSVKKGDDIVIRYTEALAIEITK